MSNEANDDLVEFLKGLLVGIVPNLEIEANANFFEMGLESIDVLEFANRIEEFGGGEIAILPMILEEPSIAYIATTLRQELGNEHIQKILNSGAQA